MPAERPLLGAIEAGGTKFVLGVGHGPDEVIEQQQIDTRDPATTLADVNAFFARHEGLAAIGIGSFGPLERDPRSAQWGHILATPKPGWSQFDLAGAVARAFRVPVAFDTDVNAAALAEARLGAARDAAVSVYVTIGTGIGGGVIANGAIIGGAGHPELGHMRPRRSADDHGFDGICPFHGDCLEGLTSGPAIKARWGESLSHLPTDHPGHAIIAGYLAEMCNTLRAVLAPDGIVLGGGVMGTPGLFERVIEAAAGSDGGYFALPAAQVIRRPVLAPVSGLAGAFLLAADLL
ncbi:ROK family protein [Blastomonas aquatica]|uniref:fructokinase n=1 Tax=Blastomonas aquatica TaxID=1510276 RepID=A0ABQ1IV19_9SPHN|nr:ROK family protein [Blastomonas aquatica]GGB51751.1 fructokinase [Blastomonas aquatica]